jgi:hypothetical protein
MGGPWQSNSEVSQNLLKFLGSSAPDVWFLHTTQLDDYITCPTDCEETDEEA